MLSTALPSRRYESKQMASSSTHRPLLLLPLMPDLLLLQPCLLLLLLLPDLLLLQACLLLLLLLLHPEGLSLGPAAAPRQQS